MFHTVIAAIAKT